MKEGNNSSGLEPVKRGFRTRLRYGNGLRGRFMIALTDLSAAERRLDELQTLANMLAKAGKHQEAPIILRKAASLRNESEFREVARFTEQLCTGKVSATQPSTPTVTELGKDWTSGKLHERYPDQVKLKRTADDDHQRLSDYVYPVIGPKPINLVTLDDCERVMARLPAGLSQMTRRNVGQTLVRLLNMAVYPLRHIERSPIPHGFLPKMPKAKAMACLYPDEDRRLMACQAVPLEFRLLWGFLCREGMRQSEALSLTFADVDLSRGAVRLDRNKTDDPRAWALSPGVAKSLATYKAKFRPDAKAGDLVFVDVNGAAFDPLELAGTLRTHLEAIGLREERPQLFTSTQERMMIRVHDLRGTFVTVALANGRSESWISDRTGHRSSQMIAKYKRPSRTFEELHLGDLLPLDQAIPELVEKRPTSDPCERNPANARGASRRGNGTNKARTARRGTPEHIRKPQVSSSNLEVGSRKTWLNHSRSQPFSVHTWREWSRVGPSASGQNRTQYDAKKHWAWQWRGNGNGNENAGCAHR
jgi:integrase